MSNQLIGFISSASLLFLLFGLAVRPYEMQWSRRKFTVRNRVKFTLPYEDRVNVYLKYASVNMTAKQWVSFILLFLIGVPILGMVFIHNTIISASVGAYMAFVTFMYPYQKRKRREGELEESLRQVKIVMAQLLKRGVHIDELLPIVVDTTSGSLKPLLNQAIARMKTTDTLADAMLWMSDQTGLASMRQLGITLIQANNYDGTSPEERLMELATEDKQNLWVKLQKRSDQKKTSALMYASIFIAMPTLMFFSILVFYHVFSVYQQNVHL